MIQTQQKSLKIIYIGIMLQRLFSFFIENNFNNSSYEIFNCSEDSNNLSNISNKKLKELGFIFDQYH